ncbi:Mov34/MPN/PAD-1 family protein [Delftia acidovorans]|uniref:Mov34/MPN/PAD-1 family protein n=1 Tax=Delftia acidovorans TaxID=80866 RepID=UPI001EFD1F5A|nr:Mov34/MPN/PAD-1 family protein [Delftia acidovorans]MCG8986231.1 Mov34/MPN/PAD-1 family protein [Delftia acidovorans]
MQFLSDWATPDRSILLNFAEDVLVRFQAYIQTGNLPEAGGIILGTVHEQGILITKVTKPTRADCRMKYFFQRNETGHQMIARRNYDKSKGTVRYLGEWHTHPQDRPIPSTLDILEWKKLARKRADQRPLLTVIVGRSGLHVELVHRNGCRIELAAI